MISKCPNCQAENDHEDYLFEVECQKCRTRFNPFMQTEDFSESQSAFAEIRTFGETGGEPALPPIPTHDSGETVASEPKEIPVAPKPRAAAPRPQRESITIVRKTSASFAEGLLPAVTSFFDPISFLVPLSDNPNPLELALEVLKEKAAAAGANSLLDVECLCDSGHFVVLATPALLSRSV